MERDAEFEQLVRAAGPPLLGLLIKFTRRREIADELLQDVWLRAWREFDRMDRGRDPLPWLRTLALNRAIDWSRSAKWMQTRPLADSAPSRAPADAKLDVPLAGLSHHERAAILLYYQEGRAVLEIAQFLDAQPATVKTWLHRARQKLKLQFERGREAT
ncbi:MAG: RNA polymerase sigma factor [Planctomycetes bacterium]|nr:RNA polymerase sigma factor [Planctomycetota bacterium]